MKFFKIFAVHFGQRAYRDDLIMSYLCVLVPNLNFSRIGACNLAIGSILAILLTSLL